MADAKVMSFFLKKNEGFSLNTQNLCKNGGLINKPVISILGNVIGLLMLYVAYCVMPNVLKIPLVVVYLLLMILPVYDIVQMFTLNKQKLEDKCVNLMNGNIRKGGIWTLYYIVNVIIGLIIWISLFYYIIRFIFYWDNVCKR